jgi:hypothetical protein
MAEDARAELADATAQLNAVVGEFTASAGPPGSDVDKAQRRKIIDAASKILAAAKDPADEWMDVTAQVALFTANHLLSEWKVFDAIPLDGSISYAELAEKTDCDVVLLSKPSLFLCLASVRPPQLILWSVARMGGVCVSMGVLAQIGPDRVAHTKRSRIFVGGAPEGLVYQLAYVSSLSPSVPSHV